MTNFQCGDRVLITHNSNKYKNYALLGCIGTVRCAYTNNIAVEVDDCSNKNSSYGCFYFNASQLKKLKKGDEKIMEGNYMIAEVQFLEGSNTERTYRYALYDFNIGIGDICVVKSAHHGLGIARVKSISAKTDEEITREIICKADFSDYEARVAIRKRKDELKRKMADRAAKLQELALYKMMAAEDADMAELMREFDGLGAC